LLNVTTAKTLSASVVEGTALVYEMIQFACIERSFHTSQAARPLYFYAASNQSAMDAAAKAEISQLPCPKETPQSNIYQDKPDKIGIEPEWQETL
jgi:hypothetical protein